MNGEGVSQQIRTYCLIAGALWFVAIGRTAAQQPPEWLYTPPQHPGILFSAGVSALYRSDSLSFRNARLNALENLAKQYRVRIVSKRAERRYGGRALSYGYTLEYVDTLVFRRCLEHSVTVDSLIRGSYAYLLLAVAEDLARPKMPDNLAPSYVSPGTGPPEWVYQLPHQEGIVFGVGISLPYRHIDDAWANSAKQARREIAMNLLTQKSYLENEQVSEGGTVYSKWSEGQTEITLAQCIIKERWYDPKEKLYYTLAEYKLSQ